MTTNHTDASVETLLREALQERGDTFSPQVRGLEPPGRHTSRNSGTGRNPATTRYRKLAPALLAAAAVVALVVGAAALIGGNRPDQSATPAAPGQSGMPAAGGAHETSPADGHAPGDLATDGHAPGDLATDGHAPGDLATGDLAPVGSATGAPQPGGDIVTPLADPVTVTGSGTGDVPMGTPPAGTDAIAIQLTCLTAGRFEFSDGAASVCGVADVGSLSAHAGYRLNADAATRGTTITAAAGERWSVTATYVSVTTSAWGLNARGQTFGVENDSGTPDLVSAYATNGRDGYVLATDLDGATHPKTPTDAATFQSPPRTIPVYASDGTTQIGVFAIN